MWPDRGGPSRASGQGGSGESRGSARNEPTSEAPRQHEAWEGRGTSGALSTTRTFPVCVLLVIPGSHVLENLAPADRVGQRADGDQLWTTLPPLWTECPSTVDRMSIAVSSLWRNRRTPWLQRSDRHFCSAQLWMNISCPEVVPGCDP